MASSVGAEKGSGDCGLSVRQRSHNGWKQYKLDQPDVVARHIEFVLPAASHAYRGLELQYRRAFSVPHGPGQGDGTLIQHAFCCCRDSPGRQASTEQTTHA